MLAALFQTRVRHHRIELTTAERVVLDRCLQTRTGGDAPLLAGAVPRANRGDGIEIKIGRLGHALLCNQLLIRHNLCAFLLVLGCVGHFR